MLKIIITKKHCKEKIGTFSDRDLDSLGYDKRLYDFYTPYEYDVIFNKVPLTYLKVYTEVKLNKFELKITPIYTLGDLSEIKRASNNFVKFFVEKDKGESDEIKSSE